ncbi:50S ribosomal protein L21 [bioreactor metagenome]|uniref:50S ribosomal protein L21 n=1 Tax=bioreactor metagenome TaxID=1076179 RepID=A0A645HPB5_9ZZZZ
MNAEVAFETLLVADDSGVKVGKPILEGVVVRGKVLDHGKGKKVIIFKYKPKKNSRTKNGHRQPFTKVEILSIG